MSESHISQPFAYIIIVEPDSKIRDLIQRTVEVPNCAVDVARDEDEAVLKSSQHRPQLIIVKRHEPINIYTFHPPSVRSAIRICRRARLSHEVILVTHSDASIAISIDRERQVHKQFSEPDQYILTKVAYKTRKRFLEEWFSYCGREKALQFISDYLPYWLGRTRISPYGDIGLIKPWVKFDKIYYN